MAGFNMSQLLVLLVWMTYNLYAVVAHPPGVVESVYSTRNAELGTHECFLGISGTSYFVQAHREVALADSAIQKRSSDFDLFFDSGNDTPHCLRTQDGRATCVSSDSTWQKIEDPTEDRYCSSSLDELVTRFKILVEEEEAATGNGGNPFKPANVVMICGLHGASQETHTINCQKAGYYCSWDKTLKREKPNSNWDCEGFCSCEDFNPKPLCYTWNGAVICAREVALENVSIDLPSENSLELGDTKHITEPIDSEETVPGNEQITVPPPSFDSSNQSLNLESRQIGQNNFAMNCLDDPESTVYCGKKGYYCDSSGSIKHRGDDGDWACEYGTCKCINLNPGPKCFFGTYRPENKISCEQSNAHAGAGKRSVGLLENGTWVSGIEATN